MNETPFVEVKRKYRNVIRNMTLKKMNQAKKEDDGGLNKEEKESENQKMAFAMALEK